MADARGDALQPRLGDQRVELLHVAAAPLRIARHDIAHALQPALLQPARRLDQHFLALPAGQPRGHQHDALVRRDVPGLAQPRDPRGLDRAGGEFRKVRAAMDDAQPRPRPGVEARDQAGGIFGIGDHRVAARHHRIIAQFERRSSGIGAMEGRHERHARDAARHQRDPGGRARAGVNDIDALVDDQPREAPRIEQHRYGIFGGGGKRRQQAADRLQFAGQPSAFGRHQSARAGRHQRGGDVDRRALGAAGVDARNDLQDRAPGQRCALAAAVRRKISGAHRRPDC